MPLHDCWWTRRHETELIHRAGYLAGAGLPIDSLAVVAAGLDTRLSTRPSADDDYGLELSFGEDARGSIHDGCFFSLEPSTIELRRAVLEATLALHERYLSMTVDWSPLMPALVGMWPPETVLRLRSTPAARTLTVRSWPEGAGMVARRLAKATDIDCSTGIAQLRA